MKALQEKDGAYEEEDIVLYTTSVHAIKTALANIGESELSAIADKLEQAGKNRETAVMSAVTPAFLSELQIIIEKLTPQKAEGEDSQITYGDYGYLNKKLLVIKNACSTYDRKVVKDTILELRQEKWPSAVNEQLEAMTEYMMSGDFGEVSRATDRIITIIS